MSNNNPTYKQYKTQVNNLVTSKELSVEQAILLLSIYKGFLEGSPVHINYLMQRSGLGWKEANWTLNGLVQRKAIKIVEKKWYTI